MKTLIIILSITMGCLSSSCMKDYTCVCTNSKTGDKTNGDKFKSGPIRYRAFEETCKNTETLSLGELKDCHLE